MTHRPQIPVAASIDDQRFVTSAEQMSDQLVLTIEPPRVGPQEPFHSGYKIGLGGFDHQVKMVTHQTPGMHLPIRTQALLPKGFQKQQPICVVPENGPSSIPTAHEVINRPLILHA